MRTPTAPVEPAGTGGLPRDDGAAGAAGGGGGVAVEDDEVDPVNPCPLCLGNEDDSGECGACYACGQMYCGECNDTGSVRAVGDLCPTCRAPFDVSDEENHKRLWSLVHDRTPGRHTPEAQYNLGCMYADGEGVAQDNAQAARWHRLAAEQGHKRAQYNLGVLHRDGTGVAQDRAEAARWCRKAAEQGHAKAQFNLGNMCRDGIGVEQDHAEAVRWCRKAAEQGHVGAQCNLGARHTQGLGTPPDLRRAAEWFRKAAAQGQAEASTNLERLAQAPMTTLGTPVVVTGLTASPQFNGRTGLVQGLAPRPGRLAVLLDGDNKPTSLREANLRKADGF